MEKIHELLKECEEVTDWLLKLQKKRETEKAEICDAIEEDYLTRLEILKENIKTEAELATAEYETKEEELKYQLARASDKIREIEIRNDLGEYKTEDDYILAVSERKSILEKTENDLLFVRNELEKLSEIATGNISVKASTGGSDEITDEVLEFADEDDIVKCPNCGANNSLERDYCSECGTELLEGLDL